VLRDALLRVNKNTVFRYGITFRATHYPEVEREMHGAELTPEESAESASRQMLRPGADFLARTGVNTTGTMFPRTHDGRQTQLTALSIYRGVDQAFFQLVR
jgi:hypothetical protein